MASGWVHLENFINVEEDGKIDSQVRAVRPTRLSHDHLGVAKPNIEVKAQNLSLLRTRRGLASVRWLSWSLEIHCGGSTLVCTNEARSYVNATFSGSMYTAWSI